MPGEFDHSAGWTTIGTAINISDNGSTSPLSNYSHEGKLGSLLGVEIAYGATAIRGVEIYTRDNYDGSTSYLAPGDWPPFFTVMNFAASTTFRTVLWLPGYIPMGKVTIYNPSGATVTAGYWIRQPTVLS